jgi:hypothetical protein
MSTSLQQTNRLQVDQHSQSAHASLSQMLAAMEGQLLPPGVGGQPTGGPTGGPTGPHDDPLIKQALVHVRNAQQNLAQAMRILGVQPPVR